MRCDWLWEIHEPIQFYTAHKMSIRSKLASSDGKYVAGVSADNTVKLWRITTDCVQSPTHIYTYALGDLFKNGVALEPEDKTVAEQDVFCQKDADGQERSMYQRSQGAYRRSEAYILEENKMDSLEEIIRLKEFANMDTVARLAMRIQSTSDTIEIYKLYNQLIDSLENRLKLAVDCKEELIEAYKKQSWKALLVKNFETAERVSRKCLALDVKALRMKKNLGHALFFQGKYNDALKVYQDYAADTPEDKQKTNVQLILKDFDILEKIGITHADIEKIIKIL